MKHKKIEHWDDERALGNGIIVTLKYGYRWEPADDATVRGFDTVTEAKQAVRDAVRFAQDDWKQADPAW